MKVRNGFVSNSSSASFVIIWQPRQNINSQSFREDVENLFRYNNKSNYYISEVMKHTNEVQKEDFYHTSFFTSMFNGIDDFGEAAKALLFATTIYGCLVQYNLLEDS